MRIIFTKHRLLNASESQHDFTPFFPLLFPSKGAHRHACVTSAEEQQLELSPCPAPHSFMSTLPTAPSVSSVPGTGKPILFLQLVTLQLLSSTGQPTGGDPALVTSFHLPKKIPDGKDRVPVQQVTALLASKVTPQAVPHPSPRQVPAGSTGFVPSSPTPLFPPRHLIKKLKDIASKNQH